MCRTACSSPPLLKTSKNLKEHIITNWAILLIWEILRCLRILKVVQESRSTQWLRTIRRPEPTNWALWARDLQLRYEHGYCQGTSLTVLSLAQAPRSSSHVMHRDEVKTQPNWSDLFRSKQYGGSGAALSIGGHERRDSCPTVVWFRSIMWKWIEGSGWQNFLLVLVNNGDQCYQQTTTGYVLIMHCTFKLQSSKVCTKASKRSEIAGGTNTTRTERGRLFSDAFHSNSCVPLCICLLLPCVLWYWIYITTRLVNMNMSAFICGIQRILVYGIT